MPRSGTGWPGRGLLWEGKCGGKPFLQLFSVGIYATARTLMARMELGLTRIEEISSLSCRKMTKSLSQHGGGEQVGCLILAGGVSGFDLLSE